VSEVNPDPVAKLARFTPTATDPAELLFAAGRASARTHWGWKVAVAGLIASNLALGALVAFRSPTAVPAPQPEPVPVAQPLPVAPAPEPPTPPPAPVDEPWSYRTLRGADLEHTPKPEILPPLAPREPLTMRSGRRGEID
jgi:hypothetical protein